MFNTLDLKDQTDVEATIPKSIIIDGVECGDVKPCKRYGDKLVWHACIHRKHPQVCLGLLAQGEGPTPRAAVADAIVKARRDREVTAQLLVQLEEQLGTIGMSDQQIINAGEQPAGSEVR